VNGDRVVVVGGGTMGVGIAAVFAAAGAEVELADADAERTAIAVERARDAWAGIDPDADGSRVAGVALDRAAREPALVIEAVPERIDLKRSVLRAAERLDPGILATNTSGIPIRTLADGLRAPQRLIGMHFFNPVPKMALVEVVVGPATTAHVRDGALMAVERIGKEAIVVRDAPGFATSRLGIALGLEAIRMVEQDVAAPADIDRAMVLGYRHPVGPLRLTDIVGLDVRLDIARTLQASYGERFAPPALLVEMVADGLLGRKAGRGFYAW
jgi:3-hydroxybutyryl-CoA dehydrogenase